MCNGEIISYGIDKHPSATNVMNALDKAIEIIYGYVQWRNHKLWHR
jgi:hypothetical protein